MLILLFKGGLCRYYRHLVLILQNTIKLVQPLTLLLAIYEKEIKEAFVFYTEEFLELRHIFTIHQNNTKKNEHILENRLAYGYKRKVGWKEMATVQTKCVTRGNLTTITSQHQPANPV